MPHPRTPLLAVVLVAAVNPLASADPAMLVVTGTCPERQELERALARVLSAGRADGGPGTPPGQRVEVVDQGAAFRVRVGGAERQFFDRGRVCAERAHTAAAFAGVMLNLAPEPATVPAVPRRPPTGSDAPVTPSRPAPPPRRLRGMVAAMALAEASPPEGWGFGGALRGGLAVGPVGSRAGVWLGAAVGASALAPIDLSFAAVPTRLTRLPLDASATLEVGGRRVRFAARLGLGLEIDGASAQGPRSGRTVWAAAAGVAAGVELRLALGPVEPLLALHARWLPDPVVVAVEPTGRVGTLPGWAVGLGVGVALPLPAP